MGDLKRLRSSVVWIILIVAVIALWFIVVNNGGSTPRKDFGTVASEIQAGKVRKLVQSENSSTVKVEYNDDTNTANSSALLQIPVQVESTDLRLVVFAPSPEVHVNDALDFDFVVNNLGQRGVPDLQFHLARPAGTVISAINAPGWNCPAAGPALADLTCTRALGAGEQTTVEVQLTVQASAQGTQFQVQPSIASSVPDPDASNNAASLNFTVGTVEMRVFGNGFE